MNPGPLKYTHRTVAILIGSQVTHTREINAVNRQEQKCYDTAGSSKSTPVRGKGRLVLKFKEQTSAPLSRRYFTNRGSLFGTKCSSHYLSNLLFFSALVSKYVLSYSTLSVLLLLMCFHLLCVQHIYQQQQGSAAWNDSCDLVSIIMSFQKLRGDKT